MKPRKIPIKEKMDIVLVRQEARELARKVGFSPIDQAKIATAISELADSIVQNVKNGSIMQGAVTIVEIVPTAEGRRGIEVSLWGLDLPPSTVPAIATIGRLIDNLEVSQQGGSLVIVLRKWVIP